MKALGIAVSYPPRNQGRPIVTCVLLEGTRSASSVAEAFDLKTPSDEPIDQLHDLARALASKLSGLSAEVAVIKLADFAPRASRSQAKRVRLMIEGSLVLSCRDKNLPVSARNGKELGLEMGMSKQALMDLAKSIDPARDDAAAAALSALQP